MAVMSSFGLAIQSEVHVPGLHCICVAVPADSIVGNNKGLVTFFAVLKQTTDYETIPNMVG